jgi:hypothetical protein
MNVLGLVQSDVELFFELALRANNDQVKAMLAYLQGELKRRQALGIGDLT